MIVTRNRLALGTVAAVAALSPASVSAAGAQSTAVGCNARGAMTWTSMTASYRLRLHIGMMGMDTGMSMGGSSTHHLEVQICSKKIGAVIANAKPTIRLVDDSAGGMMTKLPVAMMQGIGDGMEDFHYGNNVTVRGGHKFTVKVALNGQTAVFRVQMPKGA